MLGITVVFVGVLKTCYIKNIIYLCVILCTIVQRYQFIDPFGVCILVRSLDKHNTLVLSITPWFLADFVQKDNRSGNVSKVRALNLFF